MKSIRVTAQLVDGGEQGFIYGQEFLDRLAALEAEGRFGKDLVDRLITDDWGAPPNLVSIQGTDARGETIDRVLTYE